VHVACVASTGFALDGSLFRSCTCRAVVGGGVWVVALACGRSVLKFKLKEW
jgi:hypothetical protein